MAEMTKGQITFTVAPTQASWSNSAMLPTIQPPQFIVQAGDLQEHKAEIKRLEEHNKALKARLARVRALVAVAKGKTAIISLADLEKALEDE